MKGKLKFFNTLYLIISGVAIAAYLFLNNGVFLSASFTYNVSEEVLYEQAVDDEVLEDYFGITIPDLFSDQSQIAFEVTVTVNYSSLIKAWTETNDNFATDNLSGVENFVGHQILEPAFDKFAEEQIAEDLNNIAETAILKTLEKTCFKHLDSYSRASTGYSCFDAMEENPYNTDGLNKKQFDQAMIYLQSYLDVALTEPRYFDGIHDATGDIAGFRETMEPYVRAIKRVEDEDDENVVQLTLQRMVNDVEAYFLAYGMFNEDGLICTYYDAIGSILSHLIDHTDYEDGTNSAPLVSHPLIDKLFAPLKAYVDTENSEFDNQYAEMFFNILDQSSMNDPDVDRLFVLMVWGIRFFGIFLVLFMVGWVIKVFQCLIGYFRKKPYIRMNPFGIVTNVFEILLAVVTIVTVIMYSLPNINSLRNAIPLFAAIPIGLSFEMRFVALIPGLMAIVNILLSIVYGPIKKKFKEDARDEILYSTDFNDYE